MKGKNTIRGLVVGLILLTFGHDRVVAQVLIPGIDAVVTLFADSSFKPVAMVKRVGDPLGFQYNAAAPFSALNWTPPAIAPPITTWTDSVMGQVFGTTIDAVGNVYFAATAMYFSPGGGFDATRLTPASVSAATAGETGFHVVSSAAGRGETGLIYKADKTALNTVTCIITAENNATATPLVSGLNTTRFPNTGYGIGNIAVATAYNTLYASNLEDGRIYCIDLGLVTPKVIDVFDPLAPDNGTAGIAPLGERVFAVGVNNEFDGTTRLYYSVLIKSNKSVIRSVQLTAGGHFLPLTDVQEIDIPVSIYNTCVSDIAFSVRGELLVAEKGDPHHAHVYQYYGRHNAWSIAQNIPVSDYTPLDGITFYQNSGGGVDYGFVEKKDSTFVCDSLIWTMENAMDNVTWYGMQSIPHNGFTVTAPPAPYPLNEAYVVDLDGIPGLWPENVKGRFGDIVFYDGKCTAGPTDICGLVSATISKDTGSCCYNIRVSNKYNAQYFTGLTIETGHLNIDNVTAGTGWGGITYKGDKMVSFGDTSKLWYMPVDSPTVASPGSFLLARICLSGSGPDVLKFRWIGNAPQFDTVCEKDLQVAGCGVAVDTNCVGVFNQKAVCINGVITMQFQVRNNSSFTMRAITIYSLNPDAKPGSSFFPIPDLTPGSTSPVYSVPLDIKNNATSGCFFFSACDLHAFPGSSGQYPKFCCMDSIQYCVQIPFCNLCDAITLSATKSDSVNCCYKLNITNNYVGSGVKCLQFIGQGGTQFAVFSGWNIQAPVASDNITICAPGGNISNGMFAEFANFCITGTSTPPYIVSVNFLDDSGKIVCTKELQFDSCKLVQPTCANVVGDSFYCDGNKTRFSFHIKNNSTFPLYQIDLRLSDTLFKLSQYFIQPTPAIQPGVTAGPYVITVDSTDTAADAFCLYLTGHNNIYIPDSIAATECCTDSMGVVCLPVIRCDSTVVCLTCDSSRCCVFDSLSIPNGITPNNDGINDAFVIKNAEKCSNIAVTVYNRWGNIVFKNAHYTNNWKGENNNGETLPQGTYFVVVQLPGGAKKALYVDVRY